MLPKEKTIFDFLDEVEEEKRSLEDERERYKITDTNTAENVLARYKRIQNRMLNLNAQADEYVAQVQAKHKAYMDTVIEPMKQELEFLADRLSEFAQEQLKNSKKKSLKLVEGTLAFKRTQDKYNHDDAAILEYIKNAKNLQQYLKPQPAKLDWAKMKEDGEFRAYNDEAGNVIENFYVNDVKIPMVSIERNLPPTFTIK